LEAINTYHNYCQSDPFANYPQAITFLPVLVQSSSNRYILHPSALSIEPSEGVTSGQPAVSTSTSHPGFHDANFPFPFCNTSGKCRVRLVTYVPVHRRSKQDGHFESIGARANFSKFRTEQSFPAIIPLPSTSWSKLKIDEDYTR